MLKVGGPETGGALALQEVLVPPGNFIPVHLHRNEEEAWYVLEGSLTFTLGDRTIEGPAGSFVLSPRGVAHSYGNAGTQLAGVLLLFSPAGMEHYCAERETSRLREKGDRLAPAHAPGGRLLTKSL